MTTREILLDGEAQRLFEQLGGIDDERRVSPPESSEDLTGALIQEEKRRDEWRILLMELVYHLSSFLSGVRLSGLTPRLRDEIQSLNAIFAKINEIPGHQGEILLRYRGGAYAGKRQSSKNADYVISFGPYTVDIPVIKSMVNRRGITLSHLPGRLSQAFLTFSSMEINTLHLDIRNWGKAEASRMNEALQIFACYLTTTSGKNGAGQSSALSSSPAVVYNEHAQPDPNLTLLAGLNNLNERTIRDLVAKVKGMMNNPGLEEFTSVYGALFAFKKLREQLVKPPIEINNLRWLIASNDKQMVTKEESFLVRKIEEKYRNSLPEAAEVIQGIYGSDFRDIKTEALEQRMGRVGDFIDAVGEAEESATVQHAVLRNLEHRLEEVPDEIFEGLTIHKDVIERKTAQGEAVTTRINSKIADLLSFFKRRSGTKKKVREMVHRPIDFDEQDYETMARDFKTSPEEIKVLVTLLRGCFSGSGAFLRGAFEKNKADFARHDRKVFAFLWHYLKEIQVRSDRVAFLNCLQALVSDMKNPGETVVFLLDDLLSDPAGVDFSDRNNMMLANAFLRKTLREHYHDMEITPEEVLLYGDNRLNIELIAQIRLHIEQDQERFFHKVRAVHMKLLDALSQEESGEKPLPVRFLVMLEREVYIYLSLVGGAMANKVLRGAVKEYGDVSSGVYRAGQSSRHLKEILMLLQVSVRGLTRLRDPEDLPLIEHIREQKELLSDLFKKIHGDGVVSKLMDWVAEAWKSEASSLSA